MVDFGRRSPSTHSTYPVAESRRDRPDSFRTFNTVNLIGCVQGHVNPQLRADAALRVLEDAVAESVAADVRLRAAAGQRRGRPEMAALFVAEVKGFSARIAHGVVVPGSEAELVGILAPRAGQAALRDDGSEVRVGQHIHPRRRRHLPVRGRNHILAPIRGESSQPVEEDQIVARQRWAAGGSARCALVGVKARNAHFRQAATVDLVPQRSLGCR